MTQIIIAVAAKVSEYLVAPIGRQLSYLFCYRSYADELHNKVQKLGKARDDVLVTVEEATRRGDQIRPIVQEWLNRVDEITGEVEELKKDENRSCFNGWCPNLKSRYLLSREAYKKAQVIVEVQGDRDFPDGVSHRVPAQNVTYKNYEHFESRAPILGKIMDALRDDKTSKIGVWGMGGVGKTTLVAQVAAQAQQQKLFDNVLTAYVSQTVDLKKIRQEIADVIGLKFVEESESGRAGRLSQRLTQEKKLLIILDDLWAGLDLKDIGIPSDHRGLKMVLTSRKHSVLFNEMGIEKNFAVEHLSEEEARTLFKKEAGESIEEHDLQHTAEEVLKRCGGLPLAIVSVAKALKGKDSIIWRDALRQLTRSIETTIEGIEATIFLSLELSYNYLYGEEVKSLFLLCGLMGYGDTPIDNLFKYGVGLDLFQNINALEEARDRLHTLINKLKASSLLLESNRGAYVRMHDVVRQVARAIASKDPHRFVVREDDRLEEWSKTDESKSCTFISLNCRAAHELPECLVCPQLKFCLLRSNNPSLNVPNTFFEGMKGLEVLDLSYMRFTTLPSSLDSLANLQTLCLDGCELGDIALIGKLTKLQILSLKGSTIEQLPNEMVQLTNLRLLDLNYCWELEVIPRNILSSLSRLECLYMNSFTRWAIEGESNACLSELNHLSRLTILDLDLHIPDIKLLPKEYTFLEKLTRYSIFIGDWSSFRYCKTSRTLKLSEVDRSLYVGDGIGKLLKKTEELVLRKLIGTKSIPYELDEGFCELKHLHVSASPEIQYVIDSKDQRVQQHGAFPSLESLILDELINLEEVCCGPIPVKFFDNLKTLDVEKCHGLKFLFLLSMARGLLQLEKIEIKSCNVIQQIVYERESEIKEDDHETNLQPFPKLRSLKLEDLPELMNFGYFDSELGMTSQGTCSQDNLDIHMPFFSYKVSFLLNLEELVLKKLPKLKEMDVGNLQNLRILQLEELCLLSKVSFPPNLEELVLKNLPKLIEMDVGNLPNLRILRLEELHGCLLSKVSLPPNLEEIVLKRHPELMEIDFGILPKLKILNLEKLPQLRHIICNEDKIISKRCVLFPSMFKNFHNLRELHIIDCGMEDEKGINTSTNNEVLSHEKAPFLESRASTSNKIMEALELWKLSGTKYVLYPSDRESFRELKHLEVGDSPEIQYIIDSKNQQFLQHGAFPLLESLILLYLENLEEVWHGPIPIGSFGNLKTLKVDSCPKLKFLLLLSTARGLSQLEEMTIEDCNAMQQIIAYERESEIEEDGHVGTNLQLFPKLRSLKLESLPQLINFSSELETTSSTSLSTNTRLEDSFFSHKVSFPKLEELTLGNLPKLKDIWHHQLPFESFSNLQILKVYKCPCLLNLVPSHLIHSFQILKEIDVQDCELLEHVIILQEIDGNVEILSKLETLKLENLPRLRWIEDGMIG